MMSRSRPARCARQRKSSQSAARAPPFVFNSEGASTPGDPQIPNPPSSPPATAAMSRRVFGQAIGAAAVGSTLQTVLAGTVAAESDPRANPLAQQAKDRTDELLYLSATELAARIRSKQVSAREVMAAHLTQIERINPKVNAIVTLVGERALADALRADELL